jgi:hypothetical protein
MLGAMDPEKKRKLVVPAVLAIATIATGSTILTGCTTTPAQNDAASNDTAVVADAGSDAGCIPPEEYDPVSHSCVPLV